MAVLEYIDITPDVTLFSKLGQMGYTVQTALCEFVDNSLDAGSARPVSVDISLDSSNGVIRVSDACSGMTVDQLKQAFIIGASAAATDPGKIGEYGFGLKAAASFLARSFVVTTLKDGADAAYSVTFDESSFVDGATWRLPVVRMAGGAMPRAGTVVELNNLRVDLTSVSPQSVAKHLAMIYREYISESRLRLTVNGVLVEPDRVVLLDEPRWNVDFSVAGGKRVVGWIGVRDPRRVTDTSSPPGLDLVHRGRLIRYGQWIGIKYHPRLRHLVGTIHLDEFGVNANKTDFVRDSEEWAQFVDGMSNLLNKTFKVKTAVYSASGRKNLATDTSQHSLFTASAERPATQGSSADAQDHPTADTVSAPPNEAATAGPELEVPPASRRTLITSPSCLAFSDLHPRVRAACERLYRQSHYSLAARQALDEVRLHAQERAGVADDMGTTMLRGLLKADKPAEGQTRLLLNDLATLSDRDEQEGFSHLMAGAQQGIRNVLAHSQREIGPVRALEYMFLASLLCKEVDRTRVVKFEEGAGDK